MFYKRPRTHRRRHRLTTLRLVREGTFSAPEGYLDGRVAIRWPRDVFDFMARELRQWRGRTKPGDGSTGATESNPHRLEDEHRQVQPARTLA